MLTTRVITELIKRSMRNSKAIGYVSRKTKKTYLLPVFFNFFSRP